MRSPLIVILGPPGSGKTSIARSLAVEIESERCLPLAHIELDDVRHFIINNCDDQSDAPIWFSLLCQMLPVCSSNCFATVVDGLFFNPAHIEYLLANADQTLVLKVEVPLSVCLERNRMRDSKLEILPEAEVRKLYEVCRPYHSVAIDNSGDLAVTVSIVKQLAAKEFGWI